MKLENIGRTNGRDFIASPYTATKPPHLSESLVSRVLEPLPATDNIPLTLPPLPHSRSQCTAHNTYYPQLITIEAPSPFSGEGEWWNILPSPTEHYSCKHKRVFESYKVTTPVYRAPEVY